MTSAIGSLEAAMKHAMAVRPKVGGFPVLAEALRRAGCRKNIWDLPSCQAVYVMQQGNVVMLPLPPLIKPGEKIIVPTFDGAGVVRAIRADQQGQTTFPEFVQGVWAAGVVRYVVDFNARTVTYFGLLPGEAYEEAYPEVNVPALGM